MVTMLAGHYFEDWETLWWVRAEGRATILAGQRQMGRPSRWPENRYRQARPAGTVLAVTAERQADWAASG